MTKVKVNGLEFNEKQIYDCFVNIITRLTTDQFKRAEADILVVERALKKEVNNYGQSI